MNFENDRILLPMWQLRKGVHIHYEIVIEP